MKFKLATAAAAVVMTASAAQAADLAKKAPAAVDYVKVCDTYGTGFFYIPGTDTCLKISGYTRAQIAGGDGDYGSYSDARNSNSFSTRARLLLDIDARSQTEFGLLRGMGEVYFTVDTGGTVATGLDLAYIQWGGFTAGRAQSFFDFYTGYSYNFGGMSFMGPDAKTNLFGYTFNLGNGLSASVAIEDPTTNSRRASTTGTYDSDVTDTTNTVYSTDGYGGLKMPDFVANLQLTQSWGTVKVSGALHDVQASASAVANPDYNVDDEIGWAVLAGITVKLPMIGAGDEVSLQAVYADKAVKYAYADFSKSGAYFADYTLDDSNSAWSVTGGFKHYFSPSWLFQVQGGYASFDGGSNASDWDIWGVGGDLRWLPVAGLAIGVGVDYSSVDYGSGSDGDAWTIGMRVQRSF